MASAISAAGEGKPTALRGIRRVGGFLGAVGGVVFDAGADPVAVIGDGLRERDELRDLRATCPDQPAVELPHGLRDGQLELEAQLLLEQVWPVEWSVVLLDLGQAGALLGGQVVSVAQQDPASAPDGAGREDPGPVTGRAVDL